ncbi:MAG: DUF4112 domain-containing protein, partial [Prosthecobacter sp.]|nr:DUF4112 domain-containing protein [Prosthecobacter sp.]
MPPKPPQIVIDDVLPPGSPEIPVGQSGVPISELVRFLAKWLDDIFRIPGTNFKVGLDPILASIPIVGDLLATGSGLVILLEGVRAGVSLPVLLRMSGNMMVNTMLDVIPVIGPIGSAFFKSNLRNLQLLQRWQAGQQQAIRRSTTQLFIAAGLVFAAFVALWITAWVLLIWPL